MKKILIVLAGLLIASAAALAIFIATFDANRYKPLLIQKIEAATGAQIWIGRLSLAWRDGIALRVQGLVVGPPVSAGQKPDARIDEAAAVLRLSPLFHGDIQIGSIVLINPLIQIVREPNGNLIVAGIRLNRLAPPAASSARAGSAGFALLVGTVKIQNGEVYFHDLSRLIPLEVGITALDASVKNFSLTRPATFEARAAVFSTRQNVSLNGRFQPPQPNRPGSLEKFTFKTDLSSLDAAKINGTFAALRSAGLEEGLAGSLEASVDHLEIGSQSPKWTAAALRLQNGRVGFRTLAAPIEHINADLAIEPLRIQIRNFSGDAAGGKFQISGIVDEPMQGALSSWHAGFRNLALEALMPAADRSSPRLAGRLSLDLDAKAAGMQWVQIVQSLSGSGRLVLQDGLLLNYNVLRSIVNAITMVPGVDQALQTHFPEAYKAKLGEPSTVLRPVNLPFTIGGGKIRFDQLFLSTDVVSIQGAGRLRLLDGALAAQTTLRIDRGLSASLIQTVPQTQILANAQGELEMPLEIGGVLPRVTISPDQQYLSSRIAQVAAEEVMTRMIQRSSQGKGGPLGGLLNPPASQEEPSAVDAFSALLNKALKSKNG